MNTSKLTYYINYYTPWRKKIIAYPEQAAEIARAADPEALKLYDDKGVFIASLYSLCNTGEY